VPWASKGEQLWIEMSKDGITHSINASLRSVPSWQFPLPGHLPHLNALSTTLFASEQSSRNSLHQSSRQETYEPYPSSTNISNTQDRLRQLSPRSREHRVIWRSASMRMLGWKDVKRSQDPVE